MARALESKSPIHGVDELANYDFAALKLQRRSIRSETVIRKWNLASSISQAKIEEILMPVRRQAITGMYARPGEDARPSPALTALNQG